QPPRDGHGSGTRRALPGLSRLQGDASGAWKDGDRVRRVRDGHAGQHGKDRPERVQDHGGSRHGGGVCKAV
ncbi:hypothetical protein HKX48_002251, partial [Thoreauomyces humboldtii]